MHWLRKIIVPVLIAVMLTTGLGSAYGFVICDQGCLSAAHHANHHRGEEGDENKAVPFYPLTTDSEDSCTDYSIQLSDGIQEDETIFLPAAQCLSDIPFIINIVTLQQLPAGDHCPASPPVISQTLVAHRTIVLQR